MQKMSVHQSSPLVRSTSPVQCMIVDCCPGQDCAGSSECCWCRSCTYANSKSTNIAEFVAVS